MTPFTARLSQNLPELQPMGGTPPADIQWMPPGSHTITATRGGKPETITVNVGPEAVPALNRAIAEAAQKGRRAYFDFDHEGGKASAWPLEFYWGGNDPVDGGIRARVEWAASGLAAIAGHDYRQFSPSFFTDSQGRVTGAPAAMGGLVNDPAFAGIQPLFAKRGGTAQTPFEARVAEVMRQQGRDVVEAIALVSKHQPALYNHYRASLGHSEPVPMQAAALRPLSVRPELAEHPFTAAIAAQGGDAAKAAQWQPGLYEAYRLAL